MLVEPEIRRRQAPQLLQGQGLAPLLARVLANRGITNEEELSLSLSALPRLRLPDEEQAVALLLRAREEQQAIVIVGDYDADGATATALLMRALAAFGFQHVRYFVPDRFVYGYGLTEKIVAAIKSQEQPVNLVVTVDNGIASVAGVAAANAAGMQVLVTDHHLPGEVLPAAAALVNPRLEAKGAGHHLAGVGVVFYLLLALRAALREQGEPAGQVNVTQWLDLVALGTVADVIHLNHTNRILVEQGLRRIRSGQAVPGIQALLAAAKRDHSQLVATDLGFVVGPRLNAAGRLADMELGIRCLLTDAPHEAQQYAEQLQHINQERRAIEHGMQEEAARQVRRWKGKQTGNILCLYEAGWHEGVVGLVASRVKEAIHKPVFAFAPAQQEGLLKGSGRSIQGLHLKDVLERVATLQPGLLHAFGGHAMAAGLTLASQHYQAFTEVVQQAVAELSSPELFERRIDTDGALVEDELSLLVAEQLRYAFPWGAGFAAPVFDGEFEVLRSRVVGERHVKLTLGLPARQSVIDGIYFNAPEAMLTANLQRIHGVYHLEVNEWQGVRSPQLNFLFVKPL